MRKAWDRLRKRSDAKGVKHRNSGERPCYSGIENSLSRLRNAAAPMEIRGRRPRSLRTAFQQSEGESFQVTGEHEPPTKSDAKSQKQKRYRRDAGRAVNGMDEAGNYRTSEASALG